MLIGQLHEALNELDVLHLVTQQLRVVALVLVDLAHDLFNTAQLLRHGCTRVDGLLESLLLRLSPSHGNMLLSFFFLQASMVPIVHLDKVQVLLHLLLLTAHSFFCALSLAELVTLYLTQVLHVGVYDEAVLLFELLVSQDGPVRVHECILVDNLEEADASWSPVNLYLTDQELYELLLVQE